MEGVGTVVYGKFILLARKGKASLGYAVGVAAGSLSHAWAVGDIVGGTPIAESHVGHIAVAVGNNNAYDTGAKGR